MGMINQWLEFHMRRNQNSIYVAGYEQKFEQVFSFYNLWTLDELQLLQKQAKPPELQKPR